LADICRTPLASRVPGSSREDDSRPDLRFVRISPLGCRVRPNLLVLSVSRSAETRSLLSKVIESAGHKLVHAFGCDQAQILLENGVDPDFVVLELSPSTSSSNLQDILRTTSKSTVCLVHGPGEQLLQSKAVAAGVAFFLERPLVAGDVLAMLDRIYSAGIMEVELGLEHSNGTRPLGAASQTKGTVLEELGDGRYFLAAADSMLKIYRQVQLLADVDAPVLILGESGTGKEVIAHLIHKHSRRSQHHFVNVNCAALPADLLESELFGYQQGAFTGAIKDKPGKFEQANRGTLLLDEIGEMSAQMQAKLLHVLQDGQYNRLGARENSRVDVRVLAATNIQIEDALISKTFREDLYYRLNVFTINVPPLRERREEIPCLIEETVRRLPETLRKGRDLAFPSRLMDAALRYDWHGNVRELRNFVTRTVTMRDPDTAVRELETKIAAEDRVAEEEPMLPSLIESTGMRSVVRDMKDRAEAQMIKDALEVSGWNRRHAAKYLNISYRGLLYKIQQHRLAPKVPSLSRPA
jgi:two-component system response regulator AtoC